jgi:hypothetical protein
MGALVTRRRSPGRDFPPPANVSLPTRAAPLLFVLAGWVAAATAADLEEAEALFRAGKYDECVQLAQKEIGSGGGLSVCSPEVSAELARDLRRHWSHWKTPCACFR